MMKAKVFLLHFILFNLNLLHVVNFGFIYAACPTEGKDDF